MLKPEDRQKLDGIVLKMSQNNESPENIQFVVDDFKKKYESQAITPAQQTAKEPETFAEKAGGFVKDIARDITKPVVQTLAAPAQLTAYGIDKATGGNSPVEDFSFNLPFWGEISPTKTKEEAVGRGIQTVALGLGPVSGGAAFMGGQAMTENKGIGGVALDTAIGGITGKAGEVATKAVGTVLSKTGKAMQSVGAGIDALIKSAEKNYETVLGPTTKANKRITQQITRELAEREITANTRQELFEKAGEQIEKYGEQIQEFYKALPENTKVNISGVLKAIDEYKKKLFVKGEGKYIVPEVNKALFKKYQDLQIEIMSMAKNGNAPIEGIRALRQALDKSIAKTTSTFGITGEESIITEARKGVSNILRNELSKQFPDVAVINKEFTFWNRVQKVLGDTIERKTGQGTPLGEKVMTAAGAAGGFNSGGVGHAIGYALTMKWLSEAVRSTAWQTTSASLKMKIAKALSEGNNEMFESAVKDIMKASGVILEKTGNFLKATPEVLKNAPRKDIPGTSKINLKQKAKTILDEMKGKGGLSIQDVSKLPQKKNNLTTKLLKDIDGKEFVSKQYILDATNRPELKQVEKELIRDLLETEGDKINVPLFTQKVEAELLPLKVVSSGKKIKEVGFDSSALNRANNAPKYESISLPSELRGDVKDYAEHIYESPITTSAGITHFEGRTKNYFGHTRVEDMAPEYKVGNTTFKSKSEAKVFGDNPIEQPRTRRVIEVQSDLYQKGRLNDNLEIDANNLPSKEREKLLQYNNPTAHFRMVREEIKRAADDGVEKLQFPTGETGMKIEGLGGRENGWTYSDSVNRRFGIDLTPNSMKPGMEVIQDGTEKWIITDVLGDGKFKAVPKSSIDGYVESGKTFEQALERSQRTNNFLAETFDISGKVDESNPIYKFYEKELGRYLKNKYNAEIVTDKQGVQWFEVTIKPEHKGPVEAFGKAKISTVLAGAAITGALSEKMNSVKKDSVNGKTFENKKLDTTILSSKNDAPEVNKSEDRVNSTTKTKYDSQIEKTAKKYKRIPSGFLKALIDQESSMGENKTNEGAVEGKFAWLVGFTDAAKKELEKNNIPFNFDTEEGAIEAAAAYIDLKKDYRDKTGTVISTIDDLVELYVDRYNSNPNADKEKIAKLFKEKLKKYL